MLQINNIEVTYHDVILAIRGISLKVPEGSVVALLGSNGAGKTTTLRAIIGVLDSMDGDIEKGSIEFLGERIDKKNCEEVVRMGISMVPEGREIFDELTVDENIKIGGYVRRDRRGLKKNYQTVLNYFPILSERRDQIAGYLSGGEQQMLAIGRAFMSQPRLLLLDEPSLGLAPLIVKEIFSILGKINREEKTSILLVEQNANMALTLAEYGYIMESGKIVFDNKAEMLRENEDVKEFYLGLTEDSKSRNYAEVKHYKRRKRWIG